MSTPNIPDEDWKSLEDRGWADMKARLDKEKPRRGIFYWRKFFVAAAVLFVGSLAAFSLLNSTGDDAGLIAVNNKPIDQPVGQTIATPSVSTQTNTVQINPEQGSNSSQLLADQVPVVTQNTPVAQVDASVTLQPNLGLTSHTKVARTEKAYDQLALDKEPGFSVAASSQALPTPATKNEPRTTIKLGPAVELIPVVESEIAFVNAKPSAKTAPSTQANTPEGKLSDLYSPELAYQGNSAPAPTKTNTASNQDDKVVVVTPSPIAPPKQQPEVVNSKVLDSTLIQSVRVMEEGLICNIVLVPRHYAYVNALTTQWTNQGGIQLGLARKFFLKKNFSVHTGMELTRILTYSGGTNTGNDTWSDGYDLYRTSDNSLTNFLTPGTIPEFSSLDQFFVVNDEQGYPIYTSLNQVTAVYRHYLGVPVSAAYRWKRVHIEAGGAYWFQLDRHGPIRVGDNQLSLKERSNFVLKGGLGYQFYKRFSVQTGYSQGVRQLSTSMFRLYAPDRSLSLGLRYDLW
jgi:hypothetical protein